MKPLTPAEIESLERKYAALVAEVDEKEKRIAQYEKKGLLPSENDHRYNFTFIFDGTVAPLYHFPLQEVILQVKKDTLFYCKGIGQAYTVIGTRSGVTQTARLTLPQTTRMSIFTYRLKIRDTGSDMPWSAGGGAQDGWLPDSLLRSGNYNPFRFPGECHRLVSAGAEIAVQVDATFIQNDVTYTNLATITGQELQISLFGFEVPYKE